MSQNWTEAKEYREMKQIMARKWSENLLVATLAVVAFSFTSFAIQSGDCLMYLALARDFVFSGEWKFTDPYLYSLNAAPLVWTHEYLSFALFSWSHLFFGWPGMILLKSLIWTTVFVITLRAPPRWQNTSWAWIGLWLLAVVAASFRFIERSSLFSDLFCIVLYRLLLERDRLTWKFLAGVSFLFLFWAQLHPGFPIGLALLTIWSLYHTFKTRTLRAWQNLWLLCPIAAVCIHPDGPNALFYPFQFALREASVFQKYNFEWMPAYSKLFRFAFETLAFWLLAGISLFVITRERAWFTLRAIFALFAFALAMRAVRFIPWASFAILISIKPWLAFRHLRRTPKTWQALALSALLLLLTVKNLMFGYTSSSGERLAQWGLDPKFFPIKTVEFLEQHRIQGNLYNTHDFGSYLVWKKVLPIFHHGFVTDTAFYQNEAMGVFQGRARFMELAAKYNWTMLLIEKYGPYRYFYQILKDSPEWRIMAEDEGSYLIYRLPN